MTKIKEDLYLIWSEFKQVLLKYPYQVAGIWLLIVSLSIIDYMEIISFFAPIVANRAFSYFHDIHDLLALAMVVIASYRLGYAVGVLGILGFLLSHVYYFYYEGFKDMPEIIRFIVLSGVAIGTSHLIGLLRKIRGFLVEALERAERGLQRVETRYAVSMAETQARDHASLLHMAAPSLLSFMKVDFLSLHGYHAGTGQFLLLAQEGWSPEQARRMSLFKESGAIKEAVYSRQLKIIEQPFSEPTPLCSLGEEVGAWVMVLVPVVAGEKILGVLALAGKGKEDLSKENLIWLAAMGHDVGIAMDRLLILERLE